MYRFVSVVAATVVSLLCVNTIASAGSMPPEISVKIAALGRVIAVPQTNAIYAPFQSVEPYQGVKITRDIKYGPADLNALDVFTDESATGSPRPVLVVVHGGGFTRGTKKTAGSPFPENITLWAARNGMAGVNIDYRLAPQSTWPSGPEDMAATVRWLKTNIANYGGDPSRIYLLGLSAGANHVASYVAFPQFHIVGGSGLAGAILLSGSPYDPTMFEDMKSYSAYFGDDTSKYASLSPTPGLLKSTVPLMVVYAGLDPPDIEHQSINLIEALCSANRCPEKVFLKTHSHISEGDAIGTNDTELSDQLLSFIRAGKQSN